MLGNNPSLSTRPRIALHDSGLVKISARLEFEGIYSKETSPICARSLVKWCFTSICFVRQWFFSFIVFAIDPMLSA